MKKKQSIAELFNLDRILVSDENEYTAFCESYLSAPCPDCSQPMQAEHAFYLEKCEQCAGEDWERLKAWKAGEEDAHFDQLFGRSQNNPTKH